MPPKPKLEKCSDCKWCNDGPMGPECTYGPPNEVNFLHPHQWPLLLDTRHKPCSVAEARDN